MDYINETSLYILCFTLEWFNEHQNFQTNGLIFSIQSKGVEHRSLNVNRSHPYSHVKYSDSLHATQSDVSFHSHEMQYGQPKVLQELEAGRIQGIGLDEQHTSSFGNGLY